MKKALLVTTGALLLVSTAASLAQNRDDMAIRSELEALIVQSYVHGAFNELNPDAMKRGFHPDFAIFSAKGDDLGRYEIADWVAGVAQRKADPGFDPAKNRWEHKIESLDVTGRLHEGAREVPVPSGLGVVAAPRPRPSDPRSPEVRPPRRSTSTRTASSSTRTICRS